MLFTRHAFAELGMLRLFALPLADNIASIRVLQKAGFREEGILRSSCVKLRTAKGSGDGRFVRRPLVSLAVMVPIAAMEVS